MFLCAWLVSIYHTDICPWNPLFNGRLHYYCHIPLVIASNRESYCNRDFASYLISQINDATAKKSHNSKGQSDFNIISLILPYITVFNSEHELHYACCEIGESELVNPASSLWITTMIVSMWPETASAVIIPGVWKTYGTVKHYYCKNGAI